MASFMLPMRTIYEVNRLCKNFLWSGPDCATSHVTIAWGDTLFVYDEGGLGMRDLMVVNKTAL